MTLRSRIVLSVLATVLIVRVAAADPAFHATPLANGLRVEIEGSYPGVSYSVSRATDPSGAWRALSSGDVLCISACYAYDPAVEPGLTYWYRFDLRTAEGVMSFGPYPATIPVPPPIEASVTPNPGSGPVRIDLQLSGPAGSRVATEVALFDLAGRHIATIDRQAMTPGLRSLNWDGRIDGRQAPAGLYLLSFRAADGRSTTIRLTRIR